MCRKILVLEIWSTTESVPKLQGEKPGTAWDGWKSLDGQDLGHSSALKARLQAVMSTP